MSRLTRVIWLAAVVLISGCATVRAPTDIVGEPLSGRLSLRVDATPSTDARHLSAAFELRGNADHGDLALSTPLGTTLARAVWAPGSVALVTPQGETRFADLNALTREMLGESVPVAALFDWLNGRPWPGAPSEAALPPAEPGFVQLGWVVNVARIGEGWVAARREQTPGVSVRAKLDRP